MAKSTKCLRQGSVLAPTLFNVYTNDQPIAQNTKSFIYADDLCVATQSECFDEIERCLNNALIDLGAYYKQWYLNANPTKTQVCVFHLDNHKANHKLNIEWDGTQLEHCSAPIYLGVTLDRALTFRPHINKLKKKLNTRVCLLQQQMGL